jgi:hypothetical protein
MKINRVRGRIDSIVSSNKSVKSNPPRHSPAWELNVLSIVEHEADGIEDMITVDRRSCSLVGN